jgi:Leucine-rich repeat (LRR) protein
MSTIVRIQAKWFTKVLNMFVIFTMMGGFLFNNQVPVAFAQDVASSSNDETSNLINPRIMAKYSKFSKRALQAALNSIKNNRPVSLILNVQEPTLEEMKGPQIFEKQQRILIDLKLPQQDIFKQYKNIPALAVQLHSLAQLDQIEALADITYVEYNYSLNVSSMDTEASQLIHADLAYQKGYTGAGTIIAVMDTGVTTSAKTSLKGLIDDEICVISPGCSVINNKNQHGTSMLNTIHDFAPSAHFVIVRVLNDNGTGLYSNWLDGLDALAKHKNIDIVNMSLSTQATFSTACDTEFPSAVRAIRQIKQNRGIVFAASGNQGEVGLIAAPSCLQDVVAVTAVYDSSTDQKSFNAGGVNKNFADCTDGAAIPDTIPCFANNNQLVSIAAPGVSISTSLATSNGTSSATAIVSAIAALIHSSNKNLLPQQIAAILRQTGVSIQDTRHQGLPMSLKRINADAAIQKAISINFNCAPTISDPTRTEAGVPVEECQALVDLYNATDGENWTVKNGWLDNFDPCTWSGVVCNADKNVTALRLSMRGLTGSIPASIGNLTQLDELLLNGNRLSHNLPASLVSLKNLVKADLGYNMLTASNFKVRDLLTKVNSDWYTTQTITPTSINWIATAAPSINGIWFSIPYIEGNGYYEAKCGTTSGGPYSITEPSPSKAIGLIKITSTQGIQLDKNYYCRVRTVTLKDGVHNNFDLYSPFSAEFLVSTTPDGLQKRHLSFPVSLDTFVTPSRPNGGSGDDRNFAIGTYTDHTNNDAVFRNSRALLNFGVLSLIDGVISNPEIDLWPYGMNAGYGEIYVARANQAWNETTAYPGPDFAGDYGHAKFAIVPFTGPVLRKISVNTSLIDYLRQPGNFGIMIRNVVESEPGMVACSHNSDAYCSAAYTPTLEFDFLEPLPKTLNIEPGDKALNQPLDSVLKWESVPAPEGHTVTYSLFVGKSASSLSQIATGLTAEEFHYPLTYGKNYFWRVDTIDSQGPVTKGDTWSFWTTFCNRNGDLPESECLGASQIYTNFHGESWATKTNWFTTPVCDWFGIVCNSKNTHITEIHLSANTLMGQDLSMLTAFPALQQVDLSGNIIQGVLPEYLPPNLLFVDLSSNQLWGVIPSNWSCPNLLILDLSKNNLSGTIPENISSCSSLTNLKLSDNWFSGSIPVFINRLINLKTLALDRNTFTGRIPGSIGMLANLSTLTLEFNALSGEIPTDMMNLSSLSVLRINNNMLIGTDKLTSSFVEGLQPGWQDTQTISPKNLKVLGSTNNTIFLSWDAIPYNSFGSYQLVCTTEIKDNLAYNFVSVPDRQTTKTAYNSKLFAGQEYQCFAVAYTPANGEQKNNLTSSTGISVKAATTISKNVFAIDQLPYTESFALSDMVVDPQNQDQLNELCSTNGGGYMVRSKAGGDDYIYVETDDLDGGKTAIAVVTKDSSGNMVLVKCGEEKGTIESNPQVGLMAAPSSSGSSLTFYAEKGETYYIYVMRETRRGSTTLHVRDASFRSCSDAIGASPSQCQILVSLYNKLDGIVWYRNEGWLTARDICTWAGIICTNGRMTGLNLRHNNLSGLLPSNIGSLAPITYLDLSFNQINGLVPDSIKQITKPQFLNINNNQVNCTIAETISFLDKTDKNWSNTQVVAPANIQTEVTADNSLRITWTPINAYYSKGYYEIRYGTSENPAKYKILRIPGDKSVTSYLLKGLLANSIYYISIRSVSFDMVDMQTMRWVSAWSPARTVSSMENRSPIIANNDFVVSSYYNYYTWIGTFLQVLNNDFDKNHHWSKLKITGIYQPEHGKAWLMSQYLLIYKPNKGFTGIDHISYTVSDGNKNLATAVITILVTKQLNIPPKTVNDSFRIKRNSVFQADVLGNDAASLRIVDISRPRHGFVRLNKDGTITYIPFGEYTGSDHFTYTVLDAKNNYAKATVWIYVSNKP